MFRKCVGLTRLHTGSCNDQRCMRSLFKIGVLVPQVMVAKVPTMIPPQYDDGVVEDSQGIKGIQQEPDLCIGIGNRGILSMQEFSLFLCSQSNMISRTLMRYVSRNIRIIPQLT